MKASSVVASLLLLALGCGTRNDEPRTTAEDAGATPTDAGDGDAGYTMVGVYRCCEPGAGTACCDGVRQGLCFEYGGLYGDCRKQGESYEGKIICAHCCEGLEHLDNAKPGNQTPPEQDGLPDGCDVGGPPSIIVCGKCGDGICAAGESFCNCPADCPRR